MVQNKLPEDKVALALLARTANEFLLYIDPLSKQMEHALLEMRDPQLHEPFEWHFIAEQHGAFCARIAQERLLYATLLPYLDADQIAVSLKNVTDAEEGFSERVRKGEISEQDRQHHFVGADWHQSKNVNVAKQIVKSVEILQHEIIKKLSQDCEPPELSRNVSERLSVAPENTQKTESVEQPETRLEKNTKPRKLLTGWYEIADAVEMNYKERDKIKSLNDRYEGPIKNRGQGTQPIAYRDELLDWWNNLTTQAQEMANQCEGAKLSAEDQHNYSRSGTAAPEIGGGVKKRRKDKKT